MNMPLAPHRLGMERPDQKFYFFHKTNTSMADFVSFVKYESSQAKNEWDMYQNQDRNKSKPDITV